MKTGRFLLCSIFLSVIETIWLTTCISNVGISALQGHSVSDL
jgi:hypothetical protein